MQCFEFLRFWQRKNTRTLNYVRQANRKTKENQRDKKGKMFLDKGRKVITEVVKDSYKGTFITEVYLLFA